MYLCNENTCWVFFLTSNEIKIESRHIIDIIYGVHVLLHKGISRQNIIAIIDGPLPDIAEDYEYLEKIISIKYVQNIPQIVRKNKFENLVLFVTGHGGIDGLPYVTSIKPFHFLNCIRRIKQLRNAIIYMGQCYAGIFHYMSVQSRHDEHKKQLSPEIIVIGATNLFTSISTSKSYSLNADGRTWPANLFLYYVFEWISNPKDIDGDGKYTVIDSYKYAGAKTNQEYTYRKNYLFLLILEIQKKINDIEEKLKFHSKESSIYKKLELEKKAEILNFSQKSEIYFNHQEPWILNSMPAQLIEFKL